MEAGTDNHRELNETVTSFRQIAAEPIQCVPQPPTDHASVSTVELLKTIIAKIELNKSLRYDRTTAQEAKMVDFTQGFRLIRMRRRLI
ncbi:hypothetical protein RRG08_058625 [Elysia crispata]|uniref:Uncharacterized protein n=1 Tax=Elysia crispata TaxID=231223 RepID=A0AAE0Z0R1_9GAST|nr:hypothetical protein RRG08_058625 [Elysia crispata]